MKTISTSNNYLKFLSADVMTMNISDRAFRVYCILQYKYRQHVNGATDSIKVFQCHNAWLADKLNVSVRNIERAIKELHEAQLLYSFQPKGEAAYRVPVDPADTNYKELVSIINAFESQKVLRKVKWIEHNKRVEEATPVVESKNVEEEEAPVVEPAQEKAPEPASQPASTYDYNRFVNFIKRQYSLPITVDVENKVFTVRTGNIKLLTEWNEGLAPHGWSVK